MSQELWRVGGKVKYNVYSGSASGDDHIVCMCRTKEQARLIVESVNMARADLTDRPADPRDEQIRMLAIEVNQARDRCVELEKDIAALRRKARADEDAEWG